jgi:hypothetical protein
METIPGNARRVSRLTVNVRPVDVNLPYAPQIWLGKRRGKVSGASGLISAYVVSAAFLGFPAAVLEALECRFDFVVSGASRARMLLACTCGIPLFPNLLEQSSGMDVTMRHLRDVQIEGSLWRVQRAF